MESAASPVAALLLSSGPALMTAVMALGRLEGWSADHRLSYRLIYLMDIHINEHQVISTPTLPLRFGDVSNAELLRHGVRNDEPQQR